jgi:putative flippase GtrA
MLQQITALYKKHREVLHYLFFGGATTAVNLLAYGLAVELAGLSVTVGNALAWAVAVAFAYVTNKIWVFESRSWQPMQVLREAASFLSARVITGVFELAGVPLLMRLGLGYPLFGIEGFAAKLAISVVVIVLNYVFSKALVFRGKG